EFFSFLLLSCPEQTRTESKAQREAPAVASSTVDFATCG
ncbi:hypothetical protein CGCVW01_v013264, partial [Colletotrichum viniferum]